MCSISAQTVLSQFFFINCVIFCHWTPCAQHLFHISELAGSQLQPLLLRCFDPSRHSQVSDSFRRYQPECMGYIFTPGDSCKSGKQLPLMSSLLPNPLASISGVTCGIAGIAAVICVTIKWSQPSKVSVVNERNCFAQS